VVINDQVHIASLFGHLVNADDSTLLDRPYTKTKLWEVLKSFAKYKSPRPYGWTI
jgi:hypothetical protein